MKSYRLLIVDDEERFAKMLARRLTLRGCVCEICHTGQAALDIAGRQRFSLILLDLQLPDIYGAEVLARWAAEGLATPVAVITGHGSEADRRRCLELGARAFLHKPLDIRQLMALLRKIGEQQT